MLPKGIICVPDTSKHGVNSISELELTINSNSGIGIDFRKLIGIRIDCFGIGIDFVGIIDLILLIVN